MLDAKRLQSLPQILPPVLTAYLDTNLAKPRNQARSPGYLIWLKSRGQVIGRRAPESERKLFREQLERVEEYLRSRPQHSRGVAIFAGPNTWEVLGLHVEVEDELHWGLPSLTQLLWLLDEHRPCGIVVTDRAGARFFRYWLGEMIEQEEKKFQLDTSEWRKKDISPPSSPGAQKTRGSQRDAFEQRVSAQYAHFYRDLAGRIHHWCEGEQLDPLLLVGPNGVVEAIRAELPTPLQNRIAVVKEDLGHVSPSELQRRIEPEITRWERQRERALVDRLLASGTGAVRGIDDTLVRLQQGKVRQLLVVRGLGGKLRQCAKCGWTDRSADRVCSLCGGDRRVVALRAALPELVRRYGVPVEVVGGEAAQKLREAGAMGALLR